MIQSLKRQIEALEKVASAPAPANDAATAASLEAMVAQQESLQKNLDAASAKLVAARLGENLEKDQQSEKLEIIEQPTVPQEPVKPNRLKVIAMALAAALLAGAGLAVSGRNPGQGNPPEQRPSVRGRWSVDRFNSLHHDGSRIACEAATNICFSGGLRAGCDRATNRSLPVPSTP